jgi:hypothetical protein
MPRQPLSIAVDKQPERLRQPAHSRKVAIMIAVYLGLVAAGFDLNMEAAMPYLLTVTFRIGRVSITLTLGLMM